MTGRLTATRAALVAVALVGAPREGITGTYGSYTLVRTGFTIAKAINVGSYSDSSAETGVFKKRHDEIDAAVKPLVAMYDAWFARAFTKKHPYAGWLGACDRTRATGLQRDYKSRLPGPQTRAAPARDEWGLSYGPSPARDVEIYVHMKGDVTQLAHGRAVVGMALAQAFLGDAPEFVLPPPASDPMPVLLERAAHGDSYSGQPSLIARLVLDARARLPELARAADDHALAPEVRILARLTWLALAHQPWTAAEWARLDEARQQVDVRLLWTWALVFAPESEQAAREAELRQHLPLSDENERYFVRDFLRGKPD